MLSVGVFCAKDKFDPSKNNRFSTAAYWWIYQAITSYLKKNYFTHFVPDDRVDLFFRYRQFCTEYRNENHKNPEPKDIKDALHVSMDTVRMLITDIDIPTLSINSPTKSVLDYYGSDENGRNTLEDSLTDENAPSVEDAVSDSITEEAVEKAFKVLTDDEQKVIRLHYGLHYKNLPMSFIEISKAMKVPVSRVRFIEYFAKIKLKSLLCKAVC